MTYGWGLAYKKPERSDVMGAIGDLYASDGSNKIFIIDPITWE
jgi:glutaminyl-peptide cyclotransferase